jgi:hypothetical protein
MGKGEKKKPKMNEKRKNRKERNRTMEIPLTPM